MKRVMWKQVFFSVALLSLAVACGTPAGKQDKTADGGLQLPLPEDVVMYQVNPRVFAPRQSFNAVAGYVDSIQALGANVVWFMPLNEVGQEKSVNSPYCVKNYKALNPEFGTMDEFKSLVSRFHGKGISVIIDWVANHTSWDNAWLANKDWYTQDAGGNIVSPANTGWLDVADLNFDNREMRLAMIDAMKFWVDSVGVDGFRCDAADFVPYDFWKQAIDSLRASGRRPLLMLAEGKRKDHFKAGFDMNYAWDFLESLRQVMRQDSCASQLFATDEAEYDSLAMGKVKLRFITNHDEMTKMSPIKEFHGERGAMAAFVLTTSLHGGALIYSSQEVGYEDTINFFRYCPVDWKANNSLRQEFCRFMKLYNSHDAIRKGSLKKYPLCDVLMYEKAKADERILFVVNVRGEAKQVALPQEWKGHVATDLMQDASLQLADTLTMEPYQYRILTY